jgi:hypothetical protein
MSRAPLGCSTSPRGSSGSEHSGTRMRSQNFGLLTPSPGKAHPPSRSARHISQSSPEPSIASTTSRSSSSSSSSGGGGGASGSASTPNPQSEGCLLDCSLDDLMVWVEANCPSPVTTMPLPPHCPATSTPAHTPTSASATSLRHALGSPVPRAAATARLASPPITRTTPDLVHGIACTPRRRGGSGSSSTPTSANSSGSHGSSSSAGCGISLRPPLHPVADPASVLPAGPSNSSSLGGSHQVSYMMLRRHPREPPRVVLSASYVGVSLFDGSLAVVLP